MYVWAPANAMMITEKNKILKHFWSIPHRIQTRKLDGINYCSKNAENRSWLIFKEQMEFGNVDYKLNGVTERLESFTVGSHYNESVSILSQMFPNVPLGIIKETISEYDGDFDKSCDVLLNHSTVTESLEQQTQEEPAAAAWEVVEKVQRKPIQKAAFKTQKKNKENVLFPKEFEVEGEFLKEIFPNISSAEIIRQLKTDGKDVMKLYDSLINHGTVKLMSKTPRVKLDVFDQENSSKKPDKTWDQIVDDIATVRLLTDANEARARYYYYKTNSMVLAVVRLIENEPPLETHKLDLSKLTSGPIKMGSNRVQMNVKPVPKKRTSSSSSSSSSDRDDIVQYAYDPTGQEAMQLEDYKLNEPALFLISDQFYIKLLVYFQGDSKRVAEVADLIIKNNAHQATFPNSLELLNELKSTYKIESVDIANEVPMEVIIEKRRPVVRNGMGQMDYIEKSDHFKRLAKESSEKAVKGYYTSLASENRSLAHLARLDQETTMQKQKIREYLRTNKLDLHNLSVEVATDTVSKVLGDWWNDELLRREQLGQRQKAGKVSEVDALVIVTGRGLHSAGGVSKLKLAVRKYLVSNKFLFDEGTSTFTVTGKSQV